MFPEKIDLMMMNKSIFKNLSPLRGRLFIFLSLIVFGSFAPQFVSAHQQPTTIVLLDVNSDKVAMELQIPLSELELAIGQNVTTDTDTLVERLSPQLKDYLTAHIHPVTENQNWLVEVTNMKVGQAEQMQSGAYQEIIVRLDLLPPPGVTTRNFTLNYDVILHQVVSHFALVSIRSDWQSGIVEKPVAAGVIMVDTKTTQIFPLEINLEKGSWRTGFESTVKLGMQHIKEGTDHLLFILVLLLPATLLVNGNNWGDFGGTQYSIKRLLKIVTAFTVGHSITLLIGALNLVQMPPKPVEMLIAVSIIISAVHAVRPIFPNKEIYIAAGFGLVHGLAFATVLADVHLGAGELALSILGFNIGIELMQLFVIALVVPWLILLSRTTFYKWIRISGASFAAFAAAAWIFERVSGTPNLIGEFIQKTSRYAPLGILILAVIALSAFVLNFISNKETALEIQQQK